MWETIVGQIGELQKLDRQFQNFGAREHRYELRPCLSAKALEQIEYNLTFKLPKELASFYLEAGNGIAGPEYGLTPADDLYADTDESFPGVRALHKAALAAGFEDISETEGLVPEDGLPGVVTLIECGCGETKSMVVEGPEAGQMLWLGEDTFVALPQTLYQLYEEWLNNSLAQFLTVERLMRSGASYTGIEEKFEELFPESPNNAGSLISSLADIRKPPELFGSPAQKLIIAHGAAQDPWFEQVLKNWQRARL